MATVVTDAAVVCRQAWKMAALAKPGKKRLAPGDARDD